MDVSDELLDLYIKYRYDKDGFINAYNEKFRKEEETKKTESFDVTEVLTDTLTKEIDRQILAGIMWELKPTFERKLRERKLKRILSNESK